MPMHACLDIQANFAKMLVGFLILERFDNLARHYLELGALSASPLAVLHPTDY
ncbi:hypothetical protein SAMN03159367_05800 [Pseudomonas sp. NFACC06-1]|nr:hypothetical protein SAMN03159367_05800 [Pseudomonas sp. NFACC06-1]